MAGSGVPSPHSLSRHIMQAQNRAEAANPLRVLVLDKDCRLDPRRASLAEAAEFLRVVEAHEPEDLSGLNVVAIPAGQKNHRLYENAEVRRRSRMLG